MAAFKDLRRNHGAARVDVALTGKRSCSSLQTCVSRSKFGRMASIHGVDPAEDPVSRAGVSVVTLADLAGRTERCMSLGSSSMANPQRAVQPKHAQVFRQRVCSSQLSQFLEGLDVCDGL